MKGNAALVLAVVSLVSFGRSALTAQAQQRIVIGPGIVLQVPLNTPSAPAGNPAALAPATGDLLQFMDGSAMHGELRRMDTASGLSWENPAANNPIDLQPLHIDSIRFAHADSVNLVPTSRLRFANGDELFGSVTSLDNDHLGFSTWFGRALTIPRASAQSITFLSSNYTILYEGPSDADGWIIGSHNPESWTFRDGVFTSGSPGTLGRDFNLSGSSTIEFDLGWSGLFDFVMRIYSDAVNHLEDYGNEYMLQFTHDEVTLRHIALHGPIQVRTLGSAPWLIPAGKNKAHVTIQSNKEEGTVAVFLDNVLVKRWKDENGFSAPGTGLLFQQVTMTGAVLTLSNFKISQWAGRYEPETSAVVTNVDVIRFINRDQAAGKIAGISGGKISLVLSDTLLQIPIARVTQINFAAAPVAPGTRGPWDVRAHFPRGGSLSFQLEKWNDKEVTGRSTIFGPVAFQPRQIRQLEFNLDRAQAPVPTVTKDVFEDLDAPVQTPPEFAQTKNSPPDGLFFRNGDLLHGQLLAIDTPSIVRWQYPDAAAPIEFKPKSIAQIDFPIAKNSIAHSADACRLLLANGDLLEGSLVSCDHAAMVFQTWYGGRLNIPRASLQSLAFIPHSPPVFNGITGLDGWTQGSTAAAFAGQSGQWVYRKGAFYADKPASIARDLKLPDVAEIQFDLAWKGGLYFAVALYTDSLQPIRLPITDRSLDFGGFYSLRFDNVFYKNIDLWPVTKEEAVPRSLGPAQFPFLNYGDRLHVDLRISKPRDKIALYLDDALIKEWVDPKGFAGEGTGMRFVQNPGGAVKMSNLRITEWDGLFADETAAEDFVPLEIPHDSFWPATGAKVTGDIESIAGGKMTVNTTNGPVKIPLTEIKAIDFAHRPSPPPQNKPAIVRATFAQGGDLTFTLDSWRPDEMIIHSADFGKARINPTAFTHMQFLLPQTNGPDGQKE